MKKNRRQEPGRDGKVLNDHMQDGYVAAGGICDLGAGAHRPYVRHKQNKLVTDSMYLKSVTWGPHERPFFT